MNKIDYNSLLKNYKFGSKLDLKTDNGLHVIIIPKRGFSKYICSLSTSFGSINTTFIDRLSKNKVTVPNGVAHYLEHKMFEMEDENGEIIDITEIFSQMGIDSNAYTDFNTTNFYIKGSDLFLEGLNLLLDNVFHPCFNDETVEKEKGIILQEEKGYSDNPNEKMFLKMFENTYSEIPYFIDVVGSEQDILDIKTSDLYLAYNTFYHPSNMTLCIVGDVDINKTMEVINDKSHYEYFDSFDNSIDSYKLGFNEPVKVNKNYDELNLDITIPIAKVMLKIDNNELYQLFDNDLCKADITLKIFFDMLYGSLSDNYQLMLDKEFIANGYNNAVRCEKESSYVEVSTNTFKPKEFSDYILNLYNNIDSFEIEEDSYSAIIKALYGSLIYSFNDVEGLCFSEIDMIYKDSDLFKALDSLLSVTIDDVKKVKELIKKDRISVLIANPNNNL